MKHTEHYYQLLRFFKFACEENWPSQEYWNDGEGYALAQELDWFDDGAEDGEAV